jgi:CDP-diacylglycerol--glycerol-3-phosphate 3-phosphatidyltransferase
MVALLCLLYSVTPDTPPRAMPWMGQPIFHIGEWMLAAAAILTLWSGAQYLKAAWPALMADEGKRVESVDRAE